MKQIESEKKASLHRPATLPALSRDIVKPELPVKIGILSRTEVCKGMNSVPREFVGAHDAGMSFGIVLKNRIGESNE